MATIYALKTKGLLENKQVFTIETKAGILPIAITEQKSGEIFMTMQHAAPQFVAFNGSKAELAQSIGLPEEAIHPDLPIVYGSTGLWTLLIPIKSLEFFLKRWHHKQLHFRLY